MQSSNISKAVMLAVIHRKNSMLLKDFLKECEKLDIALDKAIGQAFSDERIDEFGIDLNLNYVSHMRKAMAIRKLTTLADIVKIDHAIRELRRKGELVDFPTVAEKACVTDPTVRKYFGEEIKRLRRLSAQPGAKTATVLTKCNKNSASDESKDVMIMVLREKHKKIEIEDKILKEENKALLSEVIMLRQEVARLQRILNGQSK